MEILNLRLEKAQELLNQERLKIPDNYYIDYLENYREMVEVLVKEDKSTYEKYLDSYGRKIKKAGRQQN